MFSTILAWVGGVLLSIFCVYMGIGWWLTSGDKTKPSARIKDAAVLPALYAIIVIVLMWDAFRHPHESEGWN